MIRSSSRDHTLKTLNRFQKCAQGYFFSVTLIIFACTFITMPTVYSYDIEILRYRQALSMIILIEMSVNYYLTITRRGYFEPMKRLYHSQLLPQPEWKYCKDCDHLMPPRTHHCSMCRKCVLRRDHHCFFTACCIGFENQRYFIVYCFYCAVAALYGLYVNCHFMWIMFGNSTSVVHFFLPLTLIEWLFGYTDLTFLFYTFITYVCAITALGTLVIVTWQMFLAFWGTTTYELFKRVKPKRQSICGAIRSVFGSYWIINFVIPLTCIKQVGKEMDSRSTKTV